MASDATGNGPSAPQPAAGEASQPQQLIINAQYIKDLSFENPRAPASLRQQGTPPAVEINVDVKAQGVGPDTYEVVLTINASAKVQDEALFLVELSYGAVITVRHRRETDRRRRSGTRPGARRSRLHRRSRRRRRSRTSESPAPIES